MSALEQVVPEGYKQTEIGIIPNDWNNMPLRSVLKESPKYGINAAAVPLQGDLPVYIRITDITEDGYFKPTEKVGVNNPFSSFYKLSSGDIALARTGASVGKSYLYRESDGELIYAGFLIKVSPNTEMLNPEFLFHYLKTEQYWAWVIVNSMRSGQPGINGNEYGSLLIPIPHIEEQTAIANALSDVDALLTELENLIAKKQAIKTASMQQLLTGKTRLPQFATYTEGSVEGKSRGTKPSELGEIPEDWDVITIGESCDVLTGFPFPSNKYSDSGIRLLRGSNVKRGETDWSSNITQYWPNMSSNIKEYGLHEGDIVVSMDGSLVGRSYAQLSKSDLPAILLQRVARIRSEAIELNYLKEWVCSKFFTLHCDSVKTVTAIPQISPLDIRSFKLLVPSEPEEQTAIATILSDMDDEIQTLEQRLTKTSQIKQGMMQQLLTGRTRLPFDSTFDAMTEEHKGAANAN